MRYSGLIKNDITAAPGLCVSFFTQGCPHHCPGCHNPETWKMEGGQEITPEEIVEKAKRYKSYFGKKGGITFSGGEPLLQSEFVYETFVLCKDNGINTCLDTSGCILNSRVKSLLFETDRVLLDIKYTNDDDYLKYVGCSMERPMEFLSYLDSKKIPVTLRQVVIPTINDTEDNFLKLKAIEKEFSCIDKTELLPFRKICQSKYDELNIKFPFEHIPEGKI